MQKFDAALTWAEPRLLQQNVWIALEKAREVCLRGLVKRLWSLSGKKTRLPVFHIKLALQLTGALPSTSNPDSMDDDAASSAEKEKEEKEKDLLDEAECIAAALIFRGFVRGYISHEKIMVVIAAKDPFPKLASVALRAA